ncbi:PDC sensor domain-containing protein, partial [Helicobacter ibis]|nr:methyl-accepting chemotaxis protein [Helicobacter ibis]
MNSVKLKISLIANLISILCLLSLGVVTFIFVKEAIYKEVVHAEINSVSVARATMENFSNNNINFIRNVKKDLETMPEYKVNSKEALKEYFSGEIKAYKVGFNALALYIAFEDGSLLISDSETHKNGVPTRFFGGPGTEYNFTTRAWYKGAVASGDVYVSPIYEDSITKMPAMAFSAPVYRGGKLLAVVAVDVLVEDLQKQFDSIPARIFAFDENAQVFASQDRSLITGGSNADRYLNDIKRIGEISKTLKDLEPFNYVRSDGSERFVVCSRYNNYTTCISESIDEVEEPVERIAYIQSAIVVFTSLASIILLYFIISRMLTPLQ